MAEVTNELIDEVSKSMQGRLSLIEDGQREIKTELRAVRTHLSAMQVDIGNLYQIAATIEGRVGRIERRLDIAETV
jgi:chromosome segregation ATPase